MLDTKDLEHIKILKSILKQKLGDLVENILCYGSRVYNQKKDSDFDIIIITSQRVDWIKRSQIFDTIFTYALENDIVFDTKYFTNEEINHTHKNMPFIRNIVSYGITV